MSDEDEAPNIRDKIQDRLDAALQEVMADDETGGGMVLGYTAMVDYVDAEGTPAYVLCEMTGQQPPKSLGLLRFHTMSLEADVRRHFEDRDSE